MKLRQLRKKNGMTMKELGQIVGVSEATISLYETEKYEPDINMLKTFADIFHVTIDDLVERNNDAQLQSDVNIIRDQLRRDPDSRLLFEAARKATPEHIRAAAAMLKALEPEANDDAI